MLVATNVYSTHAGKLIVERLKTFLKVRMIISLMFGKDLSLLTFFWEAFFMYLAVSDKEYNPRNYFHFKRGNTVMVLIRNELI